MDEHFIQILKDNFDTIDEVECYFNLILENLKENHILDEEYKPSPDFSDESSEEVSDNDLTDEDIEVEEDKDNFLSIK